MNNKNIEEQVKEILDDFLADYDEGAGLGLYAITTKKITNLLTQQREEAVKTTFEEIGDGMVRAYRGCECCGVATFTVHTKEELDILSQQREKGNKFKQEE